MSRSKISPIAIDCGEHSVKAVQLQMHGDRLSLRDACSVEIAAPTDDSRPRHVRVAEAARRVLRVGSFRGKAAISSLRFADVTTRQIRVPATDFDSYGNYLVTEIREQYGGGGEFSFCALPVTELLESGTQKREYLCCIANATVVDEHVALLEEIGLLPTAIDLETCAQIRPFLQGSSRPSFLVVDFGYHSSRITIVRNGDPVLMRSVPIGGAEMAIALTNKLELEIETIMDLATEESPDAKNLEISVTRALSEQLDFVLGRIADCVRYCASLFQGRAVSPMRIFGSVSTLPGLTNYLSRRIGIKTEIGDPFRAIDLSFTPRRTLESEGDYATALGLALRGIEA